MLLSFVLHVLDASQFCSRERRTRDTPDSHLAFRRQGFSSCFQKGETSLKEIQLGSVAYTKFASTLSSRENV